MNNSNLSTDNEYTHTRIKKGYLKKLKILVKRNKMRSGVAQIETLIDNALGKKNK